MKPTSPRSSTFESAALLLPLALVAVFAMHLRNLRTFLDFRLHYAPQAPADTVNGLLGSGGARPLLHDPHVIAYLALPLFLVTAVMLYRRGRVARPRASLVALAITATGTIYLGGLFGMWTAFYGGIAHMDPRDAAGATATFAALIAPRGAFLLTTTLAKLAFVGLALQGLVLWSRARRARIAAACLLAGSAVFLCFWDLDNWMLLGSLLLAGGIVAARRD